jgi:hypothetical protein
MNQLDIPKLFLHIKMVISPNLTGRMVIKI